MFTDRPPPQSWFLPLICTALADQVGACTADSGEHLERDRLLVEPPVRRSRLHHRVLPADVVRGQRKLREAVANRSHDVEVTERRLDHQRVRALLDVETAFAREHAASAAASGDASGLERWLHVFEAASRARSELVRRNLNPQLVVEGLLLDLRASA